MKPLKNGQFNGHFMCVLLAIVHIRQRMYWLLVSSSSSCSSKCSSCMSETLLVFYLHIVPCLLNVNLVVNRGLNMLFSGVALRFLDNNHARLRE